MSDPDLAGSEPNSRSTGENVVSNGPTPGAADEQASAADDALVEEPCQRTPPPRRRRWRRTVLLVLLGLLTVWLGFELLTWPKVGRLRTENPVTTAFIEGYCTTEQRQGREPRVHRRWVSYRSISPHLKRAVLVAEDINFFAHSGFESVQLRIAVREAIAERSWPRGASTITQQLAKNLWLSPSRNPLRKLREALLTVQLEHTLDKRRILELYLNVVELGPGIYGTEAAARSFYDTTAADLDERQAAALAASLSRPSRWNPASPSPAYQRRIETILRRMARAKFLWKVI